MIKSFRTYLKEQQPKNNYYTLDLYQSNTALEIKSYMNELLPLVKNMLQKSDVLITIEYVNGKIDESR